MLKSIFIRLLHVTLMILLIGRIKILLDIRPEIEIIGNIKVVFHAIRLSKYGVLIVYGGIIGNKVLSVFVGSLLWLFSQITVKF